MTLQLDGPLVMIGAGKMGGALLSGMLVNGLDPALVSVQDPGPPADIAKMLADNAITLEAELPTPQTSPAILILAVKPQLMETVLPTLAKFIGPDTLVMSIAAGIPTASFERHFTPSVAIVRAMPNTPASIGQAMTVCCANAHTTKAQKELCEAVLSVVGEVGWVEDENLMDAVTAVSGSGPAYVFLMAEYLANAGVKAGLDPKLAAKLARETITGAGALMKASELDAANLRTYVTSPGGTTAAALEVLMADDGLKPLLERAVKAAANRSRELAKP